jgi:type I restriction enzyme S subunit
MEKILPKGWIISNIEQSVAILDNVRKPVSATERAKRSGNIPYYGATGLAGYIDDYLFDEELVLIGEDGAPFFDKQKNVAFIISGKSWVNNHAHVLKAKSNTLNKFILHYLNQFDYNGFVGGTTRLKLTQGDLKKIPFPLPPLPEQERIVEKLDKLFFQHEKIKKVLDRIPQLLKTFRQQVLDFEYSKLNIFKTLADLSLKIQDGAHHSPKITYDTQIENTFPYITSKNIRNNYMKLENVQYVNEEFHNSIYFRCTPEIGDVLLTKDGANTGNVTLNTLDEPFSLLSSVCLIKTKKDLLSESFLKYYFQSSVGNKRLLGEMTGTAIKRIVLKKIKMTLIPLVDLQEQQEIVRRVESLFAKADSIESRYQTLKAKIDTLPQAILHKAFKGELVPQLPNDGDAKELLEEIMALKAEPKGKKRK